MQHTTPVALMTSDAKGNHGRMQALLEHLGHFGRGANAFRWGAPLHVQHVWSLLVCHQGAPEPLRRACLATFSHAAQGSVSAYVYCYNCDL